METTVITRSRDAWATCLGAVRILPAALEAVRTSGDPERRLRLAVLEDAVSDFCRLLSANDDRGQRFFCDVEEWFASAERDTPFAFESLCVALAIDPHLVRANLAHWRATQFVHDARRWLDRRLATGA